MGQLDTPAVQKRGDPHKDGIGPLATHGFEGGIDLGAGVGVEDLDLQPYGAERPRSRPSIESRYLRQPD